MVADPEMDTRADFSSDVVVQKNKSGHIKNLPYDILLDIMSRLPVETVLECKLVCKMWYKLLHGRRSCFASMHISRQLNLLYHGGAEKLDTGLLFGCTTDESWDTLLFYGGSYNYKMDIDGEYEYKNTLRKVRHPPMHHNLPQRYMIGSCNGLICLGRQYGKRTDPIYIYNPVTGECLNLPKVVVPKESLFPSIAKGFGYIPSTNEYKVVRIFYPGYDTLGQVQVYTLGSGCGWRTKCTPFPRLNELPASFVDGFLYWFYKSEVYAFDLDKEENQMVPSPPPCHTYALGSARYDKFGLVVLRGKLCFFHQTVNAEHMEIWSLYKTDMNKSWSKDFSIVHAKQEGCGIRNFWPIIVTKNGEIVFMKSQDTIHSYDPKTTTWKEIVAEDPDRYLGSIWVYSHVNTLVSLKTLGEKWNKKSCRIKMIKVEQVEQEELQD